MPRLLLSIISLQIACSQSCGTSEQQAPEARAVQDGGPRSGEDADHQGTALSRDSDTRRSEGGHVEVGGDRRGTPLRVAVISDLNGAYGSTSYGEPVRRAVSKIIDLRPDLVISAGDMVAGQQSGLDYGAMWRAFHEAVTDRFAAEGIPFAVTPGNHDGSGSSGFAVERSHFMAEWTNRRPSLSFVDDAHYPERYAFTLGPALFVALDASTASVGRSQRRWLSQVLEEHRGEGATIVVGHLPVAPVAVGREEEFIRAPALLRALQRRRVSLYVSGHHHAYYPGKIGSLRLLSVGCLGGGPRPLIGTDEAAPRSFALLEIGARGALRVEALAGPRFRETIHRATLPEAIGEGETLILRDDVREAGGSRP